MKTKLNYYSESGRIEPIKVAISLIIITVPVFILGYIYGALIEVIPFIYINILLCVGFGFLLVLIAKIAIKLGHTRAYWLRILLGFITGFLGFYFAWASYVPSVLGEKFTTPDEFITEIIHPTTLMSGAILLNKFGVWTIGTISNAGILGLIIWTIEASILIGLPVAFILQSKVIPYSENLEQFYTETMLPGIYTINGSVEQLAIDLVAEGPKVFSEALHPVKGNEFNRFRLYSLPNEDAHYIDILKTSLKINDKGEQELTDVILLENLKVSSKTASWMKLNL